MQNAFFFAWPLLSLCMEHKQHSGLKTERQAKKARACKTLTKLRTKGILSLCIESEIIFSIYTATIALQRLSNTCWKFLVVITIKKSGTSFSSNSTNVMAPNVCNGCKLHKKWLCKCFQPKLCKGQFSWKCQRLLTRLGARLPQNYIIGIEIIINKAGGSLG